MTFSDIVTAYRYQPGHYLFLALIFALMGVPTILHVFFGFWSAP